MITSAAIVAVAVVAVHAPVLRNGFVGLDDPERIAENGALEVGSPGEALRMAFSPAANRAYPQPLTWLSFAADRALFGTAPAGYHAEGVLLHALNAVLLLLLLHRSTRRPWAAALAALLFGVHPLTVEAVAWATERNTLLAGAFALASLHAYATYAATGRRRWYLAAAAAFAASLLAKPWLFPLPLVMLALDAWPLGRSSRPAGDGALRQGCGRLALEKLPLLAISVAAGAAAIWIASFRSPDAPEPPPLALRLANAPVALVRYVWKLVFPRDLAVLYPFPDDVPLWAALLAALALVAATLAAVALRRRAPALLAGWLWFVLLTAPTLGLVQAGVWPAMADRFAYLPVMGLLFGAVFALPLPLRWPRPARLAAAAAGGAAVAALALATRAQIPRWRDTITLLTHTSEVAPNHGEYDLNLGLALLEAGRLEEAERALLRAVVHLPGSAGPHYNLGHVYAALGRRSDALREFTRAVCLETGGRHERCRGEPGAGAAAGADGR